MSIRWLLVFCLFTSVSLPAQRFPDPDVVRVQGTGTVDLIADRVLIKPMVRVESELAKDAAVKHQTLKRRAIEALKTLEIEGLTIRGLGADCEIALPGGNDPLRINLRTREPVDPVAVYSEVLELRVIGLDQRSPEERVDVVSELLDACRENGLLFGVSFQGQRSNFVSSVQNRSRGMDKRSVIFESSQAAAIEAAAEKAAFDDAKKRAERLATLAGARVGRVHVLDMTSPAELIWSATPSTGRYSKSVRVTFVLVYGD